MLNKFIRYIHTDVGARLRRRYIRWIMRNVRTVLRWLRKHPFPVVLRLVRARA